VVLVCEPVPLARPHGQLVAAIRWPTGEAYRAAHHTPGARMSSGGAPAVPAAPAAPTLAPDAIAALAHRVWGSSPTPVAALRRAAVGVLLKAPGVPNCGPYSVLASTFRQVRGVGGGRGQGLHVPAAQRSRRLRTTDRMGDQ
jgi:hypothetical protein